MGDIDVKALKRVCGQIVRGGDLDTLTDRTVRRGAEKKLGLQEKALDEPPYKQLVKDTVAEVLAALTKEQDGSGSSNGEGDQGEETPADNDGDAEQRSSDKDEADNEETEEVYSDVMDEEPVRAKPKKRESASASPQTAKRAKTTAKGGDVTITNLKTYINKCGVRKVWAKELAGMANAQQIRHLKKLLDDLGMTGRPTLEKCKQIKAKRDLQAELEEMDTGNIIGEDAAPAAGQMRSRRGAAKNISYNVDHVSDSEEESSDAEAKAEDGDSGSSENDEKPTNDRPENEADDSAEGSEEENEESDAYTEGESENDDDRAMAASEDEADSE